MHWWDEIDMGCWSSFLFSRSFALLVFFSILWWNLVGFFCCAKLNGRLIILVPDTRLSFFYVDFASCQSGGMDICCNLLHLVSVCISLTRSSWYDMLRVVKWKMDASLILGLLYCIIKLLTFAPDWNESRCLFERLDLILWNGAWSYDHMMQASMLMDNTILSCNSLAPTVVILLLSNPNRAYATVWLRMLMFSKFSSFRY